MNITFGLAVYHEEQLIGRCLESIKEVADEIIVVHDGPCHDRTIDIVRDYTQSVFVRERLGGSDPHRLFILRQAKNDWIFMIDADEFLSEELKNFLKSARLDAVYGAYSFLWPLWNGRRYVTSTNYRPCLFYRPRVWAVGLHNFPIQSVSGVKKCPYRLEHQPGENKVSFGRFSSQFKHRIDRDARSFLQPYEQLDTFHPSLIPDNFSRWYQAYQRPTWVTPWRESVRHFFGSLKNTWKEGYYGLHISLQSAVYQYKLAQRIRQYIQSDHL